MAQWCSGETLDWRSISVSCAHDVTNFSVLDPHLNFSDHLPLMASIAVSCSRSNRCYNNAQNMRNDRFDKYKYQLRWDKGELRSYYTFTGDKLMPLMKDVENMLCKNEDNLSLIHI